MNKQIIDDAIKALFNREKKWSCGKLKVIRDEMDTKLYYDYNWILCLYNNNIEDMWFKPIKWTNKDTLFIHIKQDLKNNEGENICRSANIDVFPRAVARGHADCTPRETVIEHLRSDD